MSASHLWYACYGPSMVREAFVGLLHAAPGIRLRSLPLAEVDFTLPFDLHLSGHDTSWADAPAFLSPAPTPSGVLARGYLLERSQAFDVLAAQTGNLPSLSPEEMDLVLEVLSRDGSVELGPGMYEALVGCGSFAGYPVVAFTSTWALSGLADHPPPPSSLTLLAEALRASRGLTDDELAAYLRQRPQALVA